MSLYGDIQTSVGTRRNLERLCNFRLMQTHDLLNMKTFETPQVNLKCIHHEPWTSNATVFSNTPS